MALNYLKTKKKPTGCLFSIGLIIVLTILVSLWASVQYISSENENGNQNKGRDVGIYLALFGCGMLVLAILFSAGELHEPESLQRFAAFSFVFSVLFLAIPASQINVDSNGIEAPQPAKKQRFLAALFSLGVVLLFSALIVFRLSISSTYSPHPAEQPREVVREVPIHHVLSGSTNSTHHSGKPEKIEIVIHNRNDPDNKEIHLQV